MRRVVCGLWFEKVFRGQATNHKSQATLLILPLALLGCSRGNQLFPLSVGQKWDYVFRWGVQQQTGRLEVVREVPVAGATGWELASPMGVSRLGYVGDQLVADQLSGAFLSRPLPIGIPVGKKAKWEGWIRLPSGRKAGKAEIVSTDENQTVAGRKRSVVRTVVTMKVDGHTVELVTLIAPGDGIVDQEQSTDEKLDFSVHRVTG